MHDSLLRFLSHIPEVIWAFCSLLATVFAWQCFAMERSRNQLQKNLRTFGAALHEVAGEERGDPRTGLTAEKLDQFRVALERLEGLPRVWWARVECSISLYVNDAEEEGWFITERARALLPHDVVLGQNFHSAIFNAIPGILTGLGLTGTFLAILWALYGVHYDELNTVKPVSGMEGLINGLSGKFLSSIIALLLSIVFTIREKHIVRSLRQSYESLLSSISDAIPYLSTSRILLDIHRFSAKQTVSVSNISSEVVDRFTSAFNDRVVPGLASGMSSGVAEKLQNEFRPTMERMTGSLDALQAAIVRLESEKQDSVTGDFERMTKALEESIRQALSEMGKNFRSALSGSASDEFGNVTETLETTRAVLLGMSSNFTQMQEALKVIVAKTEEVTTGQMNTGREQTEALAALMHGLMNRLQETAEQNISTVQSQLTRVVSNLTDNVTKLSVDMMDAAKDMASQSQQSASSVIKETGEWSEATSKRLEALLDNIENRSRDFKEAGAALMEAKTFMNNLLAQNANALSQMADASRNVQTYTTGLVGQSDSLKAISGDNAKVAHQLMLTSGGLKASFDQHEKLLGEYRRTIAEYKAVIDNLHEPLAKIMQATSNGLRDYNQSVEKNFTKIVEVADKLVPKAANLLSGQIEDLGGQLEELGSVITKAVERSNGRTR
jgi:methionine synthase I (cobalamin-dependent)